MVLKKILGSLMMDYSNFSILLYFSPFVFDVLSLFIWFTIYTTENAKIS